MTCTVSNTECNNDVEMCPIPVGDTVPFVFTFTQEDGTPLPLEGMYLEFTMKLTEDLADDADGVLYKKVTFGPDEVPPTGIEYMTLTSLDTAVLISGKEYHYKFKLTNPMTEPIPDEVFTLGKGMVKAE